MGRVACKKCIYISVGCDRASWQFGMDEGVGEVGGLKRVWWDEREEDTKQYKGY